MSEAPGNFWRARYLSQVMFGSRSGFGVGCCALALGLFVGCGGVVTHSGNDGEDPGAGASGPNKPGTGGSSAGGSSSVAG
jgi:hypothetical protein